MNPEKWDRIAEDFEAGRLIPANGMSEWRDIAFREAALIRRVMPDDVGTLLEVGCGVGRLTPHLALMFPRVIATDTSTACRRVTAFACHARRNVTITPGLYPDADAALCWGEIYDEDWDDAAARSHISDLSQQFPVVLVQTTRAALRLDYEGSPYVTFGEDWMLLA